MLPFALALASTAFTAFNTYANVKANKEQAKNAQRDIETQNRLLARSYEAQKQRVAQSTEEYASIVSYKTDMLRQAQLHKRQIIGYNLLKSGIGISPNDSAGQLIRLQAHSDEMQSRAEEVMHFYNRPKINVDKAGMDISINRNRQKIKNLNSSLPWANATSYAQGGFNLMNVFNKAGWLE